MMIKLLLRTAYLILYVDPIKHVKLNNLSQYCFSAISYLYFPRNDS
jgi:hypothetical protein